MGQAEPWAAHLVFFFVTLICLAFVGFSNPVYVRLTHPSSYPLSSLGLVMMLAAGLSASVWLQFVLLKGNKSWQDVVQSEAAKRIIGIETRFSSVNKPADYGTITGIDWRPEYSELDILIFNSSKEICENLDIVLKPDVLIAKTSYSGEGYKDVTIDPDVHVHPRSADINNATIPAAVLATDSGYRLRCSRLWPNGRINITMAAVTVKPEFQLGTFVMEDSSTDPSQFVLPMGLGVNNKDGHCWFGHPDAKIYGSRPRNASVLEAKGIFFMKQTKHGISEKIKIEEARITRVP